MKLEVSCLALALSTPAFADGAFDMALFLATGGPFIIIPIIAYGLTLSKKASPRLIAALLCVFGAVVGYWFGIQIAEYRIAASANSHGKIGFYAIFAVACSAGLSWAPSLIISELYPSFANDPYEK